jgi:16S rRNA (cytosine1402-N4)-methyltransferase
MKEKPLRNFPHETWTMRSLPTGTRKKTSSALFTVYSTSYRSTESVVGLRMAQDFNHTPVLERSIIELFSGLPVGVVVDATLGGGGHAKGILEHSDNVRLLGIDRDGVARDAAATKLADFGERVRIVAGTFADISTILEKERDFVKGEPVVGILMDLGVSSPQLDDPSRGFSFRSDAPLDMRMDQTSDVTAAMVIANIDQHELARLLRDHGESRFAPGIARSIKERQPTTTGELVEAVERAVPMAARRRGHVATRVFQALRVRVNDEEAQLESGLSGALDVLSPHGVLAVISYHSGEDRVVKRLLHEASTGGCTCPPELGCVCGAVPTVTLKKASALLAQPDEIGANPRARSARLRVAWRLAT